MRISDWSSDVCSSDLRDEIRRSGEGWRPPWPPHGPPHPRRGCQLRARQSSSTQRGSISRSQQELDPELNGPTGAATTSQGSNRIGRVWQYQRSEEHTSELQSLMRISYAVFCLKKKKNQRQN